MRIIPNRVGNVILRLTSKGYIGVTSITIGSLLTLGASAIDLRLYTSSMLTKEHSIDKF